MACTVSPGSIHQWKNTGYTNQFECTPQKKWTNPEALRTRQSPALFPQGLLTTTILTTPDGSRCSSTGKKTTDPVDDDDGAACRSRPRLLFLPEVGMKSGGL